MAITLGNNSSSGNNDNVDTTYLWEHTTHADTDCLVVVTSAFDTAVGDRDTTGVTFNGVAFTNITAQDDAAADLNTEIWQLTETAYGSDLGGVTANIEVTQGGKCTDACGHAIDLISVDQADPVQDSNTGTGSNSNPTVTVAGAVSGSMTIGCTTISEADSTQLSVSAGIEVGETDMGADTSSAAYRADSGTLTWTHTPADQDWGVVAANFNERRIPRYGFILYQCPAIV